MDVTLLRTLTRKSLLKFGKNADLCVQELLHKHARSYLRWVYYNCDKISFTDDILDEINIYEGDRIEKPGKYPIRHEAMQELYRRFYTKALSNVKNKRRAKRRHRLLSEGKIRSYDKSPLKLMKRNHGHKR